jgi:hypothetical protein
MLKNITKLECIVNDKEFVFLCDCDSPVVCVKEALTQFLKYACNIEDKVKADQEAQKSENESCECVEPKPE